MTPRGHFSSAEPLIYFGTNARRCGAAAASGSARNPLGVHIRATEECAQSGVHRREIAPAAPFAGLCDNAAFCTSHLHLAF